MRASAPPQAGAPPSEHALPKPRARRVAAAEAARTDNELASRVVAGGGARENGGRNGDRARPGPLAGLFGGAWARSGVLGRGGAGWRPGRGCERANPPRLHLQAHGLARARVAITPPPRPAVPRLQGRWAGRGRGDAGRRGARRAGGASNQQLAHAQAHAAAGKVPRAGRSPRAARAPAREGGPPWAARRPPARGRAAAAPPRAAAGRSRRAGPDPFCFPRIRVSHIRRRRRPAPILPRTPPPQVCGISRSSLIAIELLWAPDGPADELSAADVRTGAAGGGARAPSDGPPARCAARDTRPRAAAAAACAERPGWRGLFNRLTPRFIPLPTGQSRPDMSVHWPPLRLETPAARNRLTFPQNPHRIHPQPSPTHTDYPDLIDLSTGRPVGAAAGAAAGDAQAL